MIFFVKACCQQEFILGTIKLQNKRYTNQIHNFQSLLGFQMPQKLSLEEIQKRHPHHRTLSNYYTQSLYSNYQKTHNLISQQPQTVDFQQYLRSQHQMSSHSDHQFLEQENQTDLSQVSQKKKSQQCQNEYFKNENKKKQLGQNYTFAQEIQSHRKQKSKYFNLDILPSSVRNSFLLEEIPPQIQHYPRLQSFSSSQIINSQLQPESASKILQSSRPITISDNQEKNDIQTQIEEEIFLKISEQTKQILRLQQRLYYYQDFCKRLLISNEEKSLQINQLERKLTQSHNILKGKQEKTNKIQKEKPEKTNSIFQQKQDQINKILKLKQEKINQLQQKLLRKETQLSDFKKLNLPLTFKHKRTTSLSKQQSEKKTLVQKQNLYKFSQYQQENKILTEKFQTLLENYRKLQSRLVSMETQTEKFKKEGDTLRKKNSNLQNANKILQKEISELNIKIFQFEKQMEEITYKNYAANLVRIKSITEANGQSYWSKKLSPLGHTDLSRI